jgi:hypothetical protein
MLLIRERWKSFFKSFGRPIGVTAGSPLELSVRNSSRVPRTPRFVTVLLFLASAAILLHPDVRTSIRLSVRGVLGGYNDFYKNWHPSRWDSVKRLRKEAEHNRDPRLLALLSLLSTDVKERLRLADEAIHRDASLTWLDYEQKFSWGLDSLPPERMARLRNWDPENAALRELAAETEAYRVGKEWGGVYWPVSQYSGREGVLHLEEGPPPGPLWLAAMDAVFTATRYDDYSAQQFELIRYASDKYGVHDPDIALYVLSQRRIPNLMNLRSYNNWVLSESLKKQKKGDVAGALAEARKSLRFAHQMWLGQTTTIEALIADALGIKACETLHMLLKEGSDEASLVAFQAAEWNADILRIRFANQSTGIAGQQAAEWAGMTILLATFLIPLTILVSCASVLALWLKRLSVEARSLFLVFLSWALDAAPIVLLGACSAIYLAYQPFAQTFSAYFSAEQPTGNFEGLFEAGSVTHVLPYSVTRVATPVLFWTIATVALSALAAFLLIRMFARRLRQV